MERVARAIDNIIEFEKKRAMRSESMDVEKVTINCTQILVVSKEKKTEILLQNKLKNV